MGLPATPLQFANLAQSTLNGSISNNATGITLNSTTGFPASGNFVIVVDSELMLVTAVSGNTLTVTRGLEGSAAVSHGSGAVAAQILSAGTMQIMYNRTNYEINVLNNGLSTGATDNSGAMQALINSMIRTAVANGNTAGSYTIIVPGGSYKFLAGFITAPFIKIKPIGNVEFDFSALTSANQFCIRCHNQNSVYNDDNSAGNNSPWLGGDDGSIYIKGPGINVGTIRGLDIGNNRATTLAAAIASTTATTITIAASALSSFPIAGNYVVTVDNEQMQVTGGQGTTTLTVSRGYNSTTAATHANGAIVTQIGNLYTDFRQTSIRNVDIEFCYDDLYWEPFDIYFIKIESCRFTQAYNGLHLGNYNNGQQNNGEKCCFIDCVFDTSTNAVFAEQPAYDITFINCSFDFLANAPLLIAASAIFSTFTFDSMCHLENYSYLVISNGSTGNNVFVDFQCKLVPTTYYLSPPPAPAGNTLAASITSTATTITLSSTANLPVSGSYVLLVDSEKMVVTAGQGTTTLTVTRGTNGTTAAAHASGAACTPPGANSTGQSSPWTPLFKGVFTLSVSEMLWGYGVAYYYANAGIFACDANVIINKFKSKSAPNQMTSRSTQLLHNGNFANSYFSTTLAAAISSTTATSVSITTATALPGQGNYILQVDNEQMLVTAGQGTATLTVSRGYNSTTAATHASGATAYGLIDLDMNDIEGWTRLFTSATYGNAFTCMTDVSIAFNPSPVSLNFKAATSSNYFGLLSDPIPLPEQGGVKTLPVINGRNSTGNINAQTQFVYYKYQPIATMPVTSITRSGSTCTMTTAVPHGLVTGQLITVYGASISDYNRKSTVTVTSATQFQYSIYTGSSAASPAVAATGAALQYLPEPLVPLAAANDNYGENWSAYYSNTSQANYTGDRQWWARAGYVHAQYSSGAPQGATHVKAQLTVNSFAVNDSANLGELLADYF